MTTTYTAGELATIVRADGVVLTTPDRLADVVDLDERGLAPLTVVEVLSRGSLGALPDFVAATVVDGELRVVVRGAFAVRTVGFAVDGVGVATWTERSTPLAAGAVVEVRRRSTRTTTAARSHRPSCRRCASARPSRVSRQRRPRRRPPRRRSRSSCRTVA